MLPFSGPQTHHSPKFGVSFNDIPTPRDPDPLPKLIAERLQLNNGHPLVPTHDTFEPQVNVDPQGNISIQLPFDAHETLEESLSNMFDMMLNTLKVMAKILAGLKGDLEKVVGRDAEKFLRMLDIAMVHQQITGDETVTPAMKSFMERFQFLLETGQKMPKAEAYRHYWAALRELMDHLGGPDGYNAYQEKAQQFRQELERSQDEL
jgi:hypothetical protein